jgi:predicted dehydrogenase
MPDLPFEPSPSVEPSADSPAAAPSRRDMLRGAGLGLAAGAYLTVPTAAAPQPGRRTWKIDRAQRLGIIGAGRRGHNLLARMGYASSYVNAPDRYLDGAEVVAVCDTFEGNRRSAAEAIGRVHGKPTIYRDYRQMLAKEDLDGVVIATPDFTHAPLAVAVIKAGCDVYVEKCAANTAAQFEALEAAVEEHKPIVQVGYQLRQDAIYSQAVEVVKRGWIGEVKMARFEVHRNGENGALQHPALQGGTPPNPKDVDWELFLAGHAPEREYDPERFFEWRKFWDYCNGNCGDNQSHSVDAAEFVLGLDLPSSASASGGNYGWGGKRETPDILTAMVEYEDPGVSVLFISVDTNSYAIPGTYFFGTEGTLHVSWELRVFPDMFSEKYADAIKAGKLKIGEPMIHLRDPAAAAAIEGDASEMWLAGRGATKTTRSDGAFDTTRLHLEEWLACMRDRKQPSANVAAAKGSTMAAIMSAEAYRRGQRITAEDVGFSS